MEFVKKNQFWFIGIGVVLILVILFYGLWGLFFPNSSSSTYGNRLDGINAVAISKDTVSTLISELEANASVKSVKYDLKGRIVYLTIDVVKDTDFISASGFADQSLNYFTEEQKAYYDIQVFLTCDEDSESSLYPTAGYKHKTSVGFKWANHE